MEWFIIYLLVQIEMISSAIGSLFFFLPIGAGAIVLTLIISGIVSTEDKRTMIEVLRTETAATILKWGRRFVYIGLFALIVPMLIPTQKNMAIIVGTGIVYNVVTSDTAERVGNKAIGALEKKIDEILGDEDTVTTPEPKAEPSSAQAQSL